MHSFSWKPIYSVGDEEIDHQHQALIGLMNDYYVCQLDGAHEKAREVLARLLSLTMKHFQEEEDRMLKAKYPYFKEHQRAHQDLLKSVDGLVREYMHTPNPETAAHLSTFLKVWLTRHILGSDKKYGPYLHKLAQGQGPAEPAPRSEAAARAAT